MKEVKAREDAVALTPNEWLMAQRLKEEYWLYVVTNAASDPELYLVQNPAAKLQPERDRYCKICRRELEGESRGSEMIQDEIAELIKKGGIILIGFADKGKVKGAQIGKETLKDWANQISQSTEPRIIPEFEPNEIEGKNVVIIRIKEFPI